VRLIKGVKAVLIMLGLPQMLSVRRHRL
jgi:hypothetical protein